MWQIYEICHFLNWTHCEEPRMLRLLKGKIPLTSDGHFPLLLHLILTLPFRMDFPRVGIKSDPMKGETFSVDWPLGAVDKVFTRHRSFAEFLADSNDPNGHTQLGMWS